MKIALNSCKEGDKHGKYDEVTGDLGWLRGSGEGIDGLVFVRLCLHLNYNDHRKNICYQLRREESLSPLAQNQSFLC